MKQLPTADELKDGYREFARFAFDLLAEATTNERYLKFAAINAQICLELFLKFLFVSEGRASEIQKKKRGSTTTDFVDFSQILSHAINENIISGIKKRDLESLLDVRNAIVHRAQDGGLNEGLAEIVASCFLMIHVVSCEKLERGGLLFQNHLPHPISNNKAWVAGVQKLINNLGEKYSTIPVNCLHCDNRTLISAELTTLDSYQDIDDVVCLCCLTAMNTSHEINLLRCPSCEYQSYFVDILNPQSAQWYVGGCSCCDNKEWVRRCAECEEFYFPSRVDEISRAGKFFCTEDCGRAHDQTRT